MRPRAVRGSVPRVVTGVVVLAMAAALAPAWWWTVEEIVQDEEGALYLASFTTVATVAAAGAIAAWARGRAVLTAVLVAVVGVSAPTGFAYLGNLACLVVAVYLLFRKRAGVDV